VWGRQLQPQPKAVARYDACATCRAGHLQHVCPVLPRTAGSQLHPTAASHICSHATHPCHSRPSERAFPLACTSRLAGARSASRRSASPSRGTCSSATCASAASASADTSAGSNGKDESIVRVCAAPAVRPPAQPLPHQRHLPCKREVWERQAGGLKGRQLACPRPPSQQTHRQQCTSGQKASAPKCSAKSPPVAASTAGVVTSSIHVAGLALQGVLWWVQGCQW